MPSFDVVSEFDRFEITNAVDQANKEVSNRFDFKGVDAKYTLQEHSITMQGESEFHLQQMRPILHQKVSKRGVDLAVLKSGDTTTSGMTVKQVIHLQEGISTEDGKKIVKTIKDKKMKVQASIQGEQVRVTGKKRDDLQAVIQMLKGEDFDFALQFKNFRD